MEFFKDQGQSLCWVRVALPQLHSLADPLDPILEQSLKVSHCLDLLPLLGFDGSHPLQLILQLSLLVPVAMEGLGNLVLVFCFNTVSHFDRFQLGFKFGDELELRLIKLVLSLDSLQDICCVVMACVLPNVLEPSMLSFVSLHHPLPLTPHQLQQKLIGEVVPSILLHLFLLLFNPSLLLELLPLFPPLTLPPLYLPFILNLYLVKQESLPLCFRCLIHHHLRCFQRRVQITLCLDQRRLLREQILDDLRVLFGIQCKFLIPRSPQNNLLLVPFPHELIAQHALLVVLLDIRELGVSPDQEFHISVRHSLRVTSHLVLRLQLLDLKFEPFAAVFQTLPLHYQIIQGFLRACYFLGDLSGFAG